MRWEMTHFEHFHSYMLWSDSSRSIWIWKKICLTLNPRHLFKSMATSPQSRGGRLECGVGVFPLLALAGLPASEADLWESSFQKYQDRHVGQRLASGPHPSYHKRAAERPNLSAIPSSCLLLKNFFLFKKFQLRWSYNFSMHFMYCEHVASYCFIYL